MERRFEIVVVEFTFLLYFHLLLRPPLLVITIVEAVPPILSTATATTITTLMIIRMAMTLIEVNVRAARVPSAKRTMLTSKMEWTVATPLARSLVRMKNPLRALQQLEHYSCVTTVVLHVD